MKKLITVALNKKKLIVANWKTYLSDFKDVNLLTKLIAREISENHNLVICPSLLYIQEVINLLKNSNVKVGAQDVTHLENDVISTGSINAKQLKNTGCQYVIIGHSERRSLYLETDEIISKKVAITLSNRLIPIVCVGESIDVRDQGDTVKYITEQISNAIVQNVEKSKIIIAYEPIWAIGSGIIPKEEEIESVLTNIRKIDGLENATLLYGGSVNDKNIDILAKIQGLDGFLIGKASTDFEKLFNICNFLK